MKTILGFVLVSLIAVAPAAAKHRHHDKKRCYVEARDVRIIREYYQPRSRALPPGLAKKYERTGQLPPGWAKRIEPLPEVVERRLIVLPPEYRRGYVDGAVVVYSPRTNVMVDVVAIFDR